MAINMKSLQFVSWLKLDHLGRRILKRPLAPRMARTGDALPAYEHEPLSHENSLRLLNLWHGDEQTKEVVCDLFEVTPDEKGHRKYEAVSWTWDSAGPMNSIKINKKVNDEDTAFAFSISNNLYLALKALRDKYKSRVLWVDAICINQTDHQPDERNHQIPMMPSIYGDAEQVCVWLGSASQDSDQAIDFIETIMKDIWKLDQLCEDRHVAGDWAALLKLIMRPWFSRRWIVQEIALARNGVIYCGPRTISWRTFSDAVSLFVEVETATHRLSDIMKKESISNHIPDFFNDVADLSATLLIDTANSLFRRLPNGEKDSILSLEYLVARLSMFNTTHPSDAVYSLLAIAKNTNPTAGQTREQKALALPQLSALARGISSKPFYVNYDQPYIDTCKDFVEFSIRQSEASRALDIMCRPWAPLVQNLQPADSHLWELPSWIRSVKDAAFEVNTLPTGQKIGRVSADALVGLPTFGQRNYSAAETKRLDLRKFRFAKRSRHYSIFVEGFAYDEIGSIQEIARDGNLPITWLTAGAWVDHDQDPPDELWRTIVANRGPDGRNALTFYPTAFKESLKKGKSGDILKTAYLINYGQCSIVAQFLRRMQAVIWNRKLMHTKGHKHDKHDICRKPERPVRLGLVHQDAKPGHLICFLYGCTVPVVLRRVEIPAGQIETERIEDEESREQEAKVMIRKLLFALRTREQSRKKRKADLEELQKKRGLSSVDKTPASYYCKSKGQAVTTVPPWIDRSLRHYQAHASFCLSLVFGLCIQATESEILKHLLFSLSLAFALSFAYSQCKILRRELYNAVMRFKEKVEPWSMRVNKWRARIRPRPTPLETVKENASKYYYEFVGECYLHGMMDGEAIKYQNDNEIKAEIFEIR